MIGDVSPLACAILLAVAADAPASPKAQLHGSAQLDRHRPVVGAAVVLSREDGTGGYWLTTTDTRGGFRFEGLEDGSYRCVVRRDGLVIASRDAIALRAPYRGVVEWTLTPGVSPPEPAATDEPAAAPVRLEGSLTQQSGGPASARVRAVRVGGGADPLEARAGPDGRFVVEGVPPGTWRLEILGNGMLPLRTVLRIAADTTVRAVLVVQPANYTPLPEDLMPPEEPIPPS